MLRPALIGISLCLLILIGTPARGRTAEFQPRQPYIFSCADFVAYWSATQIFLQGKDFYSEQALRSEQEKVGCDFRIVWNPPWTFTILLPFMIWPHRTAAVVWLISNMIFLMLVPIFCWRLTSTNWRAPPAFIFLAAVTCFPVYDNLAIGQLALLITLAVAGALWALHTRRDALAGALFIVAAIKPHLLALAGLAVFVWCIQEKRFAVVWSFAVFLTAAAGITHLISPAAFSFWMTQMDTPTVWQNSTLVSAVRSLIHHCTGTAPLWPIWAVPLSAATGWVLWFKTKPRRIDWNSLSAPMLCLSLGFAPYGWIFDQSLLLITHSMILAQGWSKRLPRQMKAAVILPAVGVQLIELWLNQTWLPEYQHFFWFPFAVLASWWFARHVCAKYGVPAETPAQT